MTKKLLIAVGIALAAMACDSATASNDLPERQVQVDGQVIHIACDKKTGNLIYESDYSVGWSNGAVMALAVVPNGCEKN